MLPDIVVVNERKREAEILRERVLCQDYEVPERSQRCSVAVRFIFIDLIMSGLLITLLLGVLQTYK